MPITEQMYTALKARMGARFETASWDAVIEELAALLCVDATEELSAALDCYMTEES